MNTNIKNCIYVSTTYEFTACKSSASQCKDCQSKGKKNHLTKTLPFFCECLHYVFWVIWQVHEGGGGPFCCLCVVEFSRQKLLSLPHSRQASRYYERRSYEQWGTAEHLTFLYFDLNYATWAEFVNTVFTPCKESTFRNGFKAHRKYMTSVPLSIYFAYAAAVLRGPDKDVVSSFCKKEELLPLKNLYC